MSVTTESAAPYAPASAVLDIIDRYRHRGLATPINADVLQRAGVSASLTPRTLQALGTLDLIDEEGRPTQTLEGLRLAPENEFKKRMEDWLKAAYAEVFSFVDPSQDDEVRVRDAFRSYQPIGQQPRMVSLFLGLCAAAGLTPEKSHTASASGSLSASKPRIVSAVGKTKPKVKVFAGGGGQPQNPPLGSTPLPPALAGLLHSLPANGKGWTQDQRNKFMTTFGAVIDFVIPIKAEGEDQDDEGDADN
jgi:hypothetical protein